MEFLLNVPTKKLTAAVIPNNVKAIGDSAFYLCEKLVKVDIPNIVTEIGYSSFTGCEKLVKVDIPDSVTEIGYSAFEGCTALTSVVIPGSVTEIEGRAFCECKGLTSLVIQDGVELIGKSAFQECASLTSVTIPDSVKEIQDNAFWECPRLADIKLPKNVELGKNVFDKPKKKGKLTKNNREKIYQKVAQTLKPSCGEEVPGVSVTRFKGTADCAKRLNQFAELLSRTTDRCILEYQEEDGFFSITASAPYGGDCFISGPGDSLEDILYEYEDELTRKELEIFFELLPEKDDFWGWYYRVNDGKLYINWKTVISSLIAPDYKKKVFMTFEGFKDWEKETFELKPRKKDK